MLGLSSAVMSENYLERPALFYGAHANYTRMRELVGLILKHELPIALVNTGQHWDPNFIGDGFGPNVDTVNLGTRTSDSDKICRAAKTYLKESECDGVFVYGDTASALGPAQAAYELGLPIVHLEGGFRTYDNTGRRIDSLLPEEGIRNKIDRMADLIVPLLPSAARALREERAKGLLTGAITDPTGHPLANAILTDRAGFEATRPDRNLGVLTIHRKANLEGGKESGLAQVLEQAAELPQIEWLFPTYPATRKLIESAKLHLPSNVLDVPPLDHATMLNMIKCAGIIVSDSAGLQVEVGLAPRRMVIPRNETEYPDLLSESVVMTRPGSVRRAVEEALDAPMPSAERLAEMRTAFGDGKAARNLFQHVARLTVAGELARAA